ncbi:MAG: excinuclease ABC subunit UvrB [Candidatus Ratteibacteria bacterium]
MEFKLLSDFQPAGNQPAAIKTLTDNLRAGTKYQTLLGVTGSGKTYTMANVIAQIQKPTLVISHNKTLAAQLYGEFRNFFPENQVAYFVSYYDYYQPEAYLPTTDTYIEKDSSINEDIDRLRMYAVSSLIARRDTIVIATVSSIYPSGSPEDYTCMTLRLTKDQEIDSREIRKRLLEIQYERNDFDLSRGHFRVRGNRIEVIPSYEERGLRVEVEANRITGLAYFDTLTGKEISREEDIFIYPAKQFVTTRPKMEKALKTITAELRERLTEFRQKGKLLEAQRLEQRANYDLEMLQEMGYCHGVENYSRHFDGRLPGKRAYCLLDFFPKDFLLIIDESHISVPQIRGMYFGDRSRKETLVEYGFRLPSALDNRPLKWEEFQKFMRSVVFASATPGEYELQLSGAKHLGDKSPRIAEQIIRPTGLLDPEMKVRSTTNQIDDLLAEIKKRTAAKERTLVLTLSKNTAEELSEYLKSFGIKVEYIHCEVDTFRRVEILRQLREAKYDVLVGINLLREGLDLPEVSLVAILEADKAGFLRSETSLIQIAGRAARAINGEVILYADKITKAMHLALTETERRRKIQLEYNQTHNLKPTAIKKGIYKGIEEILNETPKVSDKLLEKEITDRNLLAVIKRLGKEMLKASRELDFERAGRIRDKIKELNGEKEIELYQRKR